MDSRTRFVGLEMAERVLLNLVGVNGVGEASTSVPATATTTDTATCGKVLLARKHLRQLEKVLSMAKQQLWRFFSSSRGDLFLDTFEDELTVARRPALIVEHLMMDESILMPPAESPLTGIAFEKRLACG